MSLRATNRSFRRRVAVIAAAVSLVTIAIVAFALPASAHTADSSGSAVCANGDHVVTWTITNPETNPNWSIVSFNSIDATVGTDHYTVSGYVLPIPPPGSTQAMTVVPGGVTGSIVLHFSAHWADGFDTGLQDSPPVDLNGPCIEDGGSSSTTTSSSSTSTSIADLGSTVASSTSTTPTSLQTEGSTAVTSTTVRAAGTPSSDAAASNVAGKSTGALPFTGSNGYTALVGLGSLAAGVAAVRYGRKRRRK